MCTGERSKQTPNQGAEDRRKLQTQLLCKLLQTGSDRWPVSPKLDQAGTFSLSTHIKTRGTALFFISGWLLLHPIAVGAAMSSGTGAAGSVNGRRWPHEWASNCPQLRLRAMERCSLQPSPPLYLSGIYKKEACSLVFSKEALGFLQSKNSFLLGRTFGGVAPFTRGRCAGWPGRLLVGCCVLCCQGPSCASQ